MLTVKLLWSTFVCLILTSCGGSSVTLGSEVTDLVAINVESTNPPASDVQGGLPLFGGPLPTANGVPDCRHFKEQTGSDEAPEEGVNCADWSLIGTIRTKTSTAKAVAIVDILTDIRVFQTSPPGYLQYQCYLESNAEWIAVTRFKVPVAIKATQWLKGDPVHVRGVAIEGACAADGSYSCSSQGKDIVIGPASYLVFLQSSCCIDQAVPGTFRLDQLYPIVDSFVYDWDGSPVDLKTVENLVRDAVASEEPYSGSYWDSPCPLPNVMENYDVPDATTSSDANSEEVSIAW